MAIEPLTVWIATTRHGDRCAFGAPSAAHAWAGKNGCVESIALRSSPDLSILKPPQLTQPLGSLLLQRLIASNCIPPDKLEQARYIALSFEGVTP